MKTVYRPHLTPLARTVSAILRNPLNLISLISLLLCLIVLCLLSFKCIVFALPIAIFEIVGTAISGRGAKLQNKRFGLPFCFLSACFCFVLSLALAAASILEHTEYKLPLPKILNISFQDNSLPLNLLNIGFDGILFIALPLALTFLAKTIFAHWLLLSLKTNTPKRTSFLLSAALDLLSFLLFAINILDRLSLTSFLVTVKALGATIVYVTIAVCLLGAVSSAVCFALNIYTFTKLRKNHYAV